MTDASILMGCRGPRTRSLLRLWRLTALRRHPWCTSRWAQRASVIERYAALGQDGDALFGQVEAVVMSADDELARLPYHEARNIIVDRFEEAYVPRVLARAENVISRAADLAGVSRPSLYRMLERLRLTDRS